MGAQLAKLLLPKLPADCELLAALYTTAFSPVAPRTAPAFSMALVASTFVPTASSSQSAGSLGSSSFASCAPMPPPCPSMIKIRFIPYIPCRYMPCRCSGSSCRKASLCETDSPDTGEVALTPEGERCPEGVEGENLAIARNISGAVQFSPPPPADGAPSQRGPRGERTFFDNLRHCSGLLMSTILHPRSTASQVAKLQGLLITCKNSLCSIFHQFLLL